MRDRQTIIRTREGRIKDQRRPPDRPRKTASASLWKWARALTATRGTKGANRAAATKNWGQQLPSPPQAARRHTTPTRQGIRFPPHASPVGLDLGPRANRRRRLPTKLGFARAQGCSPGRERVPRQGGAAENGGQFRSPPSPSPIRPKFFFKKMDHRLGSSETNPGSRWFACSPSGPVSLDAQFNIAIPSPSQGQETEATTGTFIVSPPSRVARVESSHFACPAQRWPELRELPIGADQTHGQLRFTTAAPINHRPPISGPRAPSPRQTHRRAAGPRTWIAQSLCSWQLLVGECAAHLPQFHLHLVPCLAWTFLSSRIA